ncbi:hypothetical protein LCGC14_3144630, partial [marine sediment metagenome]
HLVEIEFSTGTEYLSTGTRNLDWNSQTWVAVGGMLQLGPVEETQEVRGAGMEITLSGIDQAIVASLLGANYRGRPLSVWRAHFNRTTGLVVDAPIQLVDHLQLDGYTISEDHERGSPGTVTIKTRVSLRPSISERRGIQTNMMSHQHVFPGDKFFEFVPSLAGKKIYWGTESPMQGGGGGNSGSGDEDREGDIKA